MKTIFLYEVRSSSLSLVPLPFLPFFFSSLLFFFSPLASPSDFILLVLSLSLPLVLCPLFSPSCQPPQVDICLPLGGPFEPATTTLPLATRLTRICWQCPSSYTALSLFSPSPLPSSNNRTPRPRIHVHVDN